MGCLPLEATSVGEAAKETGEGRCKRELWRWVSLGRSGMRFAHSHSTGGASDSSPPLLTLVQKDRFLPAGAVLMTTRLCLFAYKSHLMASWPYITDSIHD